MRLDRLECLSRYYEPILINIIIPYQGISSVIPHLVSEGIHSPTQGRVGPGQDMLSEQPVYIPQAPGQSPVPGAAASQAGQP